MTYYEIGEMTAFPWSEPNLNIEDPHFVITVEWQWPTNNYWSHFRLVRKLHSPAIRIEEGQVMTEYSYTDVLDGGIDTVFRDPQPPPGDWIYYSAFFLDNDRIWNYAGSVTEIGIRDYDWTLRLPELLPGVAVNNQHGVAHPADQSNQLVEFLQAPGAFLDSAVTKAEAAQYFWDPKKVPPQMLPELARTLGWNYPTDLSMSRVREVLWALRFDDLGSVESARRIAEAATGAWVKAEISNNLMLNVADSSFENGDLGSTNWKVAESDGIEVVSPYSKKYRNYVNNGDERDRGTVTGDTLYVGYYDDFFGVQKSEVVFDQDFRNKLAGLSNGQITAATLSVDVISIAGELGSRLDLHLVSDTDLPVTVPDPAAGALGSITEILILPEQQKATLQIDLSVLDLDLLISGSSFRFASFSSSPVDYIVLSGDSIRLDVTIDNGSTLTLQVLDYFNFSSPPPVAPANVRIEHFLDLSEAGTIKCGEADPVRMGVPISTWTEVRMGCYALGDGTLDLGMDIYNSSGDFLGPLAIHNDTATSANWGWYGNADESAVAIPDFSGTLLPTDVLTNTGLWSAETTGDYSSPQLVAPVAVAEGMQLGWEAAPTTDTDLAFQGVTLTGLVQGQEYDLAVSVEAPAGAAYWRLNVAHEDSGRSFYVTDPAALSVGRENLRWRATSSSVKIGIEVSKPTGGWSTAGTHTVTEFSVVRTNSGHAYGVPTVTVGNAMRVDLIVLDDG